MEEAEDVTSVFSQDPVEVTTFHRFLGRERNRYTQQLGDEEPLRQRTSQGQI